MNRKKVKVIEPQVKDNVSLLQEATCYLSGNGFKLYCYFFFKKEKEFYLSPKEIINDYGFGGRQSIADAIKNLKINNFLEENIAKEELTFYKERNVK